MPHLESKTKLIMTASVNWYINPQKNKFVILKINTLTPCAFFLRTFCEHIFGHPQKVRRNSPQDHISLKINTQSYSLSMSFLSLWSV